MVVWVNGAQGKNLPCPRHLSCNLLRVGDQAAKHRAEASFGTGVGNRATTTEIGRYTELRYLNPLNYQYYYLLLLVMKSVKCWTSAIINGNVGAPAKPMHQ